LTLDQGQDHLIAGSGDDLLIAGAGQDTLTAGSSNDTLIAGAGNATMEGGVGYDTFVFAVPSSGPVTEAIDNATGKDQIEVLSGGQYSQIGGTGENPLAPVDGSADTWQDSAQMRYTFNPSNHQLTISGGSLGEGNQIIVNNYDLENPALGLNFMDGIDLQQADPMWLRLK
jgi:Ca2+-binding RTX toxin-like protein